MRKPAGILLAASAVGLLLGSRAFAEGVPDETVTAWGNPVNGVRLGITPLIILAGTGAKEVKIALSHENVGQEAREIPVYEKSNLTGLFFVVKQGKKMSLVQPSTAPARKEIAAVPAWRPLEPGKKLEQVIALSLGGDLPDLAENESLEIEACQAARGRASDARVLTAADSLRSGSVIVVRANAAGQQAGVLLVGVARDGSYFLGGKPIELEKLRQEIAEAAKAAGQGEDRLPRLKVFIRAHVNALFKHVQQVMLECLKLKIWDVSFGVFGEPDKALPKDARIGDCQVRTASCFFWRDWMPVVADPGEDGGSPLYAKVDLELDNSDGKAAATLSWIAHAVADDSRQALDLRPENDSKGWDGTVKAGQKLTVQLMTHAGPRLKPGTDMFVVLEIKDASGKTAAIRTASATITRTE